MREHHSSEGWHNPLASALTLTLEANTPGSLAESHYSDSVTTHLGQAN